MFYVTMGKALAFMATVACMFFILGTLSAGPFRFQTSMAVGLMVMGCLAILGMYYYAQDRVDPWRLQRDLMAKSDQSLPCSVSGTGR